MTIFSKILSTIGLLMIYGLINATIILASGSGPSVIGMFVSLGLFAGIIAIWRSKPPKKTDGDKLDKTIQ